MAMVSNATSMETRVAAPRLKLLRLMLTSREGDRREQILHRQGKGWFQLSSMGHEALGALMYHCTRDGIIVPYPRDRAMMLARGVTTKELAKEFFAKRDASSGGRQLQSHFCARDKNVWSVPSPTGSTLLPACGLSWGIQRSRHAHIVLASVGDAGIRQGEFYEALVFAKERQLPLVFVVEDNGYGISTPTLHLNPLRLGVLNEDGLVRVDGRDADAVLEAGARAIQRTRQGRGPCLLWCEVDRLASHSNSDDQRMYRSPEELAIATQRDPIRMLADRLLTSGELSLSDWETLQADVRAQVAEDYEEAERSEDPVPHETMEHIVAPSVDAPVPPIEGGGKVRMVDSFNRTLHVALSQDRRRLLFGEDIEDPKGGVFRLTSGLSTAFPAQVFNSPLAEATILGVGCGLASYGVRPIVELQFVDFVAPGFNQLMTNIATLRWRSFGAWMCPMVIYAPYGAYLPGGSIWHSQSNEALFAHIPGLRVVVPSTPHDLAGLTWTALHAEDPTVILIPKHLLRLAMEMPQEVEAVPFGKASIRQHGHEVTLVSWGNGIELAMQTASQLREEVSIELVDLRSIIPWDRDTVAASLAKTGRLVIVQEDIRSCSVGQMLITDIVGESDTWGSFMSRPQLVARQDVHIGFHPTYEYAALPSLQQIVDAVRRVMG